MIHLSYSPFLRAPIPPARCGTCRRHLDKIYTINTTHNFSTTEYFTPPTMCCALSSRGDVAMSLRRYVFTQKTDAKQNGASSPR